MAVDPEGRIIIVAQPFRYQITTQDEGLIYLVLMFREIPTEPALSVEDGPKPSRLLEAYAIYERDRLPDQAHVELARILLSTGKKNLKEAEDATAPKADEIDTRYREQAGIRPDAPPLGCGSRTNWPATAPWRTTWRGQPASSRAEQWRGWRLRRRDQPEGTAEPLDCDLLYSP